MEFIKPFSTYNGGKHGNGTYQQIINHIPQCKIFVDGFVGNGGILFNLKLPPLTIINDIDPSVIDRYNCYRSPSVIIENLDYTAVIDKYDNKTRDTFFYFDPPYLFETRSTQQKYYKFDFTDSDHFKFLSMVNTVKSNCMISHYPCKLYNDALKDWYTHDFKSMTRGGLRTERIYMNYPTPSVLQDFRYLGTDFTDRQRIKRKIERQLKKLESLPELERIGIISAVIDKYNHTAAQLQASI